MGLATIVSFRFFRFGQSLKDAKPAPPLNEEMADLTAYWHRLFRKDPTSIDGTINLQGFAPVVVQFRALCPTVALLIFPPHTPKDEQPDALCLMVNGLEGPEDIAAVKSKVQFPPEVWQSLSEAPKPVVMAVFNVNGRMRDPATSTVMQVVANVYFNSFGTNSVEGTAR